MDPTYTVARDKIALSMQEQVGSIWMIQ